MDTDAVAFWATLAATVISLRLTRLAGNISPRLFASSVMFSLNWAVLLPYYQHEGTNELLPALSGVALVLAGGALRREGAVRSAGTDIRTRSEAETISNIDRWAVILLLILAFPHLPPDLHGNEQLIVVTFGTLITLLGYWSIGNGALTLGPRVRAWPLVVILIAYSMLELAWTVTYITQNPGAMPPQFQLGFSMAKTALTIGFFATILAARVRFIEVIFP